MNLSVIIVILFTAPMVFAARGMDGVTLPIDWITNREPVPNEVLTKITRLSDFQWFENYFGLFDRRRECPEPKKLMKDFPLSKLYKMAKREENRRRWCEAARIYGEVLRQYPVAPYFEDAKIRMLMAFIEAGDMIESINQATDFLVENEHIQPNFEDYKAELEFRRKKAETNPETEEKPVESVTPPTPIKRDPVMVGSEHSENVRVLMLSLIYRKIVNSEVSTDHEWALYGLGLHQDQRNPAYPLTQNYSFKRYLDLYPKGHFVNLVKTYRERARNRLSYDELAVAQFYYERDDYFGALRHYAWVLGYGPTVRGFQPALVGAIKATTKFAVALQDREKYPVEKVIGYLNIVRPAPKEDPNFDPSKATPEELAEKLKVVQIETFDREEQIFESYKLGYELFKVLERTYPLSLDVLEVSEMLEHHQQFLPQTVLSKLRLHLGN